MKRRFALLTATACIGSAVPLAMVAQTSSGPSLSFDVATIRPNDPSDTGSHVSLDQDRFTTKNVGVTELLKFAYGLNSGSDDQIVGEPGWVQTARFDISATEDQPTARAIGKMSNDDRGKALRSMLQKLLAERFSLKVHTEMQPHTVVALVQAKGGSKLKPFIDCSQQPPPCENNGWQGMQNDGHGHVNGRGATMGMLADVLAFQTEIGHRMVVDETGLNGKYDFDLRWTPEGPSGEGSGPSLFSALEEQLGLKLKAEKLPIKVLVIDHIQPPSEN